ncbi:MAG TPA: ribosome biogenesis GTPase YlqF [Clostridiales bacterium]|nr:ribosome biogenesis GTPase YlqF [Clostridiales bacterium]
MTDTQKQNVQWFPGHMAKATRKIKESLPLVDCVSVLLDARIPMSSMNPDLDSIIEEKPQIILLNKCDLADNNTTRLWIEYFKNQDKIAIAVDCRSGRGLKQYREAVETVCAEKIQANVEKGMVGKAIRTMVVGIPNTGKSSLINRMTGNKRAKVEDRAGVTRHNQWFVAPGGLELLDTPGVLWPKFDDPSVGDKLAITGGVKDQVYDIETLACRFLEILAKDYPTRLTERYKMTDFDGLNGHELLELLGRKRGMLISGGEIDTERAAIILIDEFRAGKLGRLSFEKPDLD